MVEASSFRTAANDACGKLVRQAGVYADLPKSEKENILGRFEQRTGRHLWKKVGPFVVVGLGMAWFELSPAVGLDSYTSAR